MGLSILASTLYGQVKIGENVEDINPLALLELESTTQGMMIPRMNSEQRDQAFRPSDSPMGMIIYNTSVQALQILSEDEVTDEGSTEKYWSTYRRLDHPTVPSNPTEGELYFNQESDDLLLYTADGWVALSQKSESSDTNIQDLAEAMELVKSILNKILEDSSSPEGAMNADGVAITADELTQILRNVNPELEEAYQTAIQNHDQFSKPPTLASVQNLIDSVNQAGK